MTNTYFLVLVYAILFSNLALLPFVVESKLFLQSKIVNQTHDHKLLNEIKPKKFGQWRTWCPHVRIQVSQGVQSLHGIPRYRVIITNLCSNCWVARVHFRCSWFASATLVPPNEFKRLAYDDCLVNGGRPMASGKTIGFAYSNTYPYPLSVASFVCWP
ncbi:hypothetical protein PHJA_000692600 [Phtheirospermum japonicum]|uniref:Uncharacterized protein n=1 Tax=Phtheirospermum japonicum TaxID=374723 RepID=A0A830BJ90_9LAMI|nr:hypothetical protein PHJA_000692600 [Phtheirospermum japonicum]